MTLLDIFIPGTPKPAGSKRAIPIYRGKKGEVRSFTGHSVVVDTSGAKGKEWRADVRAAVQTARAWAPLLTGSVTVWTIFYMPRPKAHYGTGKNAAILKESAPEWYEHLQDPDADKLRRAVLDSLTGVLYRDDNQVRGWSEKRWSDDGKSGLRLRAERTENYITETTPTKKETP